MSEPVLTVTDLWKKFAPGAKRALAYGVRDMGAELLPFRDRTQGLREGEFWALRAIEFQLARGEALAVVGHNGAGKSTLLKLLYGLLKPDRGEVRVRGRAEAIIELGTGFHPLLTGRENIELGAELHGLAPAEKRRLIDQVVEFADIGEFVDAPMQTYSSGMKTRLSFALSAHLGADLLLVDEVLAVGDMTFQRKCVNLMRGYLANGGSLIFISHSAFQIQTVCERGIVLERGEQIFTGSAVEAISLLFESRPIMVDAPARAGAAGDPVEITSMDVAPLSGDRLIAGQPAQITLRYQAAQPLDVLWGFSIWTQDQWVCVSGEHSRMPVRIGPGQGELRCVVPAIPLVGGRYLLRGAILDRHSKHPLALYGFHTAPALMVVSEPVGDSSNMKMALHQLIHIDVNWE